MPYGSRELRLSRAGLKKSVEHDGHARGLTVCAIPAV